MPERRADELFKWHEEFVISGRSGPEDERRASLTYMSPTGRQLARVDFRGVGISSIGAVAPGSGEVQAEMYCEEAEFRAAG